MAGNALSEEAQIFDYSDMIYLPYIWALEPVSLYDFLFVDECQDLSRAQLYVVMKYASEEARVMAVGDPYQAIYGFAGADSESFSRVQKTFSAPKFPLTTCFRCPENVIQLAKGIRADISGKENKPEGEVLSLKPSNVYEHLQSGDLVISRTKEQLVILIFTLLDKGRTLYVHPDDATALISRFRQFFKPHERNENLSRDASKLERFWRSISDRNHFKIRKEVERKKHLTVPERQALIKERMEEVDAVLAFIQKRLHIWKQVQTVEQFFEEMAERITSESPEAVKMSSIHRAKGLENNRVFILNYDKLPHTWAGIQEWQIKQEENLKYVALTRPKQSLFLVESDNREASKKKGSLFDILPKL